MRSGLRNRMLSYGMAIYHFQLRPIQRSKGRSVVQIAAYITALKLYSPREDETFCRRTEGDIIKIGRVGSTRPIQVLLEKAEAAERRKNSIEGRHVIVAVPREVSSSEQWIMLTALAEKISKELGVPVIYALHDNEFDKGRPRNPHGHLVLPTRIWHETPGGDGHYGHKLRRLDVARTGSVIIEGFRKDWEEIVNHGLPTGIPAVSRLSHIRAGRNRIPRRHLGEVASKMEHNGFRTHYGDWNRKVDQLDRIAVATAKVERAWIPLPKQSYAEQQLQIRLDRELARAAVNIAQMPPSNAKQTLGAKQPCVTDLAPVVLVPNASKAFAPLAVDRATPMQAKTHVGPSLARSPKEPVLEHVAVAERGSPDELMPKTLEAELAEALEGVNAPPRPELPLP